MKNRMPYLSFVIVFGGTASILTGTAQSQIGPPKQVVALQPSTPGTSQSGHTNISGTAIAGQHIGGGAGLTGLNASNISSGTLAGTRLSGAYTGITGVGTLVSGTWNGNLIGTTYGGTGLNSSTTPAGSLLYTSSLGTWATRPIGAASAVLKSDGITPNWGADGLTLPYLAALGSDSSDLISLTQTGTHDAFEVFITNSANGNEAITGRSNGSGWTIYGSMTGLGVAGKFSLANTSSLNDAVQIDTNGMGSALHAQVSGAGTAANMINFVTQDDVEIAGPNGAINTNGYLYREYTLSSRSAAIPIAYGSVSSTGAVNGGTGNFTVAHTVTGEFDISIDGESYSSSTFTVMANVLVNSTPYVATIADAGVPLRVNVWNLASGVKSDFPFHFVVFKAGATSLRPESEPQPDKDGSGLPIVRKPKVP